MLRKWTLANFKAIADEVTLDLAPVTVLVGANSSGKSSVLQSILLVAQTLRAKPGEQPILLNGEYVRLGYIVDIVHSSTPNAPFVFGFEYIQSAPISPQQAPSEMDKQPIRLRASIRPDRLAADQVRAQLERLDLAWGLQDILTLAPLPDATYDLRSPRYAELDASPKLRLELQQGVYRHAIVNSSRNFRRIDPFYVQASLRHFLPARVLETYDALTEKAVGALNQIGSQLRSASGTAANPKIREITQDPLVERVVRERIQRYLNTTGKLLKEKEFQESSVWNQEKNRAINFLRHANTVAEWTEEVQRQIPTTYCQQIGRYLNYYASTAELRTKAPVNECGVQARELPNDLRLRLDLIVDFFSNHIYYIGPLRESPQFIYALPDYPEVTHVGLRGEFTASVFEHFKDQLIEYALPPGTSNDGKATAHAPLAYALEVWLEYMGLLESVTTTDRGKMGTELTVRAQGVERDLDLTSIGVGISQVLPTLVTGLIAPRGTTFLLEQPELHLHPRVQSMLADFLLGLTKVGKQCIVETHSEYLVNRLRRRVAEDASDRLLDDIHIYFVEREQGKSQFRKVDLNPFGAVVQWPRGFFDEGSNEAQQIMDAAMKKRRREMVNGPPKRP
jgi:predicted ATPase